MTSFHTVCIFESFHFQARKNIRQMTEKPIEINVKYIFVFRFLIELIKIDKKVELNRKVKNWAKRPIVNCTYVIHRVL